MSEPEEKIKQIVFKYYDTQYKDGYKVGECYHAASQKFDIELKEARKLMYEWFDLFTDRYGYSYPTFAKCPW